MRSTLPVVILGLVAVAWSFADPRGEIQTSFQAGGMTSASMRASLSASVICFPRES